MMMQPNQIQVTKGFEYTRTTQPPSELGTPRLTYTSPVMEWRMAASVIGIELELKYLRFSG